MSAPSDIVYYHRAFAHHAGARETEPAPRRHSASRQKLAGFSEKHLIELSADMYDELQRRLHPERFPPGPLAPRTDIHWKRNDARKHVGSLPAQRFDDICRDLLEEQERRYPELKSLPASSVESPQPRARRQASGASGASGVSGTSARSAGSNQSADAYAFPLSASPRENDQHSDMFESANTSARSQSPDLHIQSVAESKIEPQKTQIVESDDDSGSDSEGDVYSVYGGEARRSEASEYDDPDATPTAHARDPSETSGHTSYVTTEDMPIRTSTLDDGEHEHEHEHEHEREFAEDPQATPHLEREREFAGDPQATPHLDRSINSAPAASGPAAPGAAHVEELTSRIRELEHENGQHRTRIEQLLANQRDPDLERTLEEQRSITEQVREEAARFLEEMRSLTRQHERQVDRADTMDAEAKHWKKRYTKLQAELEAARKQRMNAAIEQPQLAELPAEWLSPSGAVAEEQLRQYFGAISALVACVHSDKGKRSDALELLHAVVLASRALTHDKRSLIAKAANLLITAVRNFAVSKGLMPLIIVDSACSDLTMAVIEFCSKQKVRAASGASATSAASAARGADSSAQPPKLHLQTQPPLQPSQSPPQPRPNTHKKNKSSVSFQFDEKRSRDLPRIPSPEEKAQPIREEPALETRRGVPQSPGRERPSPARELQSPARELPSPAASQGSATAAPSPSTPKSRESFGQGKFRPAQGPQMPLDSSIQSLQTYLEEQTSGTVDAIGALLAGIKNNVVAGELKPRVGEIQALVSQMIDASNSAIRETRNRLLKERGTLIVDNLKNCSARMDMLLDEELEAIRNDAKPNRHLKQRLAGVSFDMAKSTKELVKTVEEATLQDELDGIDRRLQ